jgi:hypothetical protein
LIGAAVNVTDPPGQMLVAVELIVTDGTITSFTVMVI